jgi:hypothetical protein
MRNMKFFALFLLALAILATPAASKAQIAVGLSVRVGPPILPVYAQPVCPGPGYIWTPGYWAYGDDGYYWVPGTWVVAPEPGLLWTPGYWGFAEGVYVWHAGYWGPHVGFYGGINYGYGYTGVGFWGGEWRGREFVYNRSVTNVNVTVVHNYYNKTVIVNNTTNVSYNGGPHGIMVRPTHDEERWAHERHIEARHEQIEHEHAARSDRRQWASENHGRPVVAASGRPGDFHRDVVAAREARDNHQDRGDHGRNKEARGKDGRDDRPGNGFGRDRDNARPREARDSRPEPSRGRDSRPEPAHGRDSHASEPHGNPHIDRGPAQHGGGHEGNNKPEHGKEHGKDKP